MTKIYRDEIFQFNQFDLREDGDIFQTILDERKDKRDSQRFFLEFLPQDVANRYDFNNIDSLEKFRDDCLRLTSPLQPMGGCNLVKEEVQRGIRYAGIKISDPNGKIFGSFNIGDGKIIYSPIFPHFYEERDNIKFANDNYFTTMTFEEIMQRQIDLAAEFYIHTGNYMALKDVAKYGDYIFEEISKDQMLEFLYQPETGEKVLRKHLGLK